MSMENLILLARKIQPTRIIGLAVDSSLRGTFFQEYLLYIIVFLSCFTTNCAISAYHHQSCVLDSMGVLYATLYDKVCCELRQVFRFPPPMKTDRHDKDEILSKVVLNTIPLNI